MKITPVQKQTRAGQRTRFKAFVVVGDSNGHVGLGVKCAKEAATAIRGAIILAKLSIVPVRRATGGTRTASPIPSHRQYAWNRQQSGGISGGGRIWPAAQVPAPWGSEIVAARVPQKVLQFAGIDDVFTSSRGSTSEMEPPPSQQNITSEWSMDCQCCSKGADLHLPVSLNKMDQRVVTVSSARSASRWPSNCRCYYCSTCALNGADTACCLPLEQAMELLLAMRASFLRQKHQVATGAGQGHDDLPYLKVEMCLARTHLSLKRLPFYFIYGSVQMQTKIVFACLWRPSIFACVAEDRMDLLRAAIIGPKGTPYHDGLFFFDAHFTSNYPSEPPEVGMDIRGFAVPDLLCGGHMPMIHNDLRQS
ncbi:40S ribosomal protein S2-4 [Triticum urartu]|uniref:40S ribosomal protein S2-4 n=1 Tax=Triticum urartu TaxID=4572 RepID=M7ZVK8_TRIUA|nr:40S ribosomal protein S2-4 [Triticum urartu]